MNRRAFRVWAPSARSVQLQLGEERIEMEPEPRGWFATTVAHAATGVDYGFVLDGGETLPDPRSRHQPLGVDGPSRVVDPASFAWTDSGWQGRPLDAAVIYELHVGTFTEEGTFEGAISRLDELVDLGVAAIEIMPVASFSGNRGWGYDGVDLYAPHHVYGGPDGLWRLVDAAHARQLAVVLDVVYNHLGPEGNRLGSFGPYFTDRYATPWGNAMNFDGPGSDEVRAFIVDNAEMWLRDYHIDALRLDAMHAIIDTSATHILESITSRVRQLEAWLGRRMQVIAESDRNDPRLVRSPDDGGYGLDAQWSDDVHHALHAAMTGERNGYYADFGSLGDVAKALRQAFVYDGRYSEYRGRSHGRPVGDVPGSRFVAYLQNHDQVGNRARGERSAALLSGGLLRAGAALLLTAPFVPMLFAGEEWGASTPFLFFTDYSDRDLQRAVSRGRRREVAAFGWPDDAVPDPQDASTFAASQLRWEEREREPHASLLRWYRQLIALRRSQPELLDGRRDLVRTRFDEEQRWLIVERGHVRVACNLGGEPVRVHQDPQRRRLLLTSAGTAPALDGDVLLLEPESVTIDVEVP